MGACSSICSPKARRCPSIWPYRPCHVEIRIKPAVIEFTWLRRGRFDADLWQEGEIPLAEAAERYRVRILAQSVVLREAYPERPVWTYEKAWYVSDLKQII